MSLLDKASLILVPGAPQKASEIWAAKPVTQSIGVTRGTTKFRTNSAGLLDSVAANVAALDYLYGGSLQSCPLWFVEDAATNIATYNETNAGTWGFAPLAASGTMLGVNAYEVLTNVGLGDAPYNLMANGFAANTNYSASVIVDFDSIASLFEFTLVLVSAQGVQRRGIQVNKTTKAITNAGSGSFSSVVASSATQLSGEIYLVTLTVNFASGLTGISSSVCYCFDALNLSTARIAALQVTAGAPTSYIGKTTNAAATRNADVIELTAASGYIGQTAGAVAGSFVVDGSGVRTVALVSDGTANNAFYTYLDANNRLNTEVYVGGFLIASEQSGVLTSGVHSYCFTYGSILTLYVDGIKGAGDTMSSVPACNSFRVGSQIGSVDFINGHVGAHVFFNSVITESQATQLSLLS